MHYPLHYPIPKYTDTLVLNVNKLKKASTAFLQGVPPLMEVKLWTDTSHNTPRITKSDCAYTPAHSEWMSSQEYLKGWYFWFSMRNENQLAQRTLYRQYNSIALSDVLNTPFYFFPKFTANTCSLWYYSQNTKYPNMNTSFRYSSDYPFPTVI